MYVRVGLLILMLGGLFTQTPLAAQQPMAAVVQITFAGVELQRANTEAWLPLPVGAQAPVGDGDTLRTDKTGRVLINFANTAEILLLPETEFRLETITQLDNQQIDLSATLVKGRSIQHVIVAAGIKHFQFNLQYMTVQNPEKPQPGLFAMQSRTDTSSDLIVTQGNLVVTKDKESRDLQGGTGIRATETLGDITPIVAPQGFSFLSITTATCYGVANATIPGEESVAVRIGPGEDYLNLGNIPNGSLVPIIGKADSGQRYLTPFLSNFGWIIANGINIQSCDNIPIVPAEAQPIKGVTNPEPFEMDLLTPVFGTPSQNAQFYVYQ